MGCRCPEALCIEKSRLDLLIQHNYFGYSGTVVFVFETIAEAALERVEKINTTVPDKNQSFVGLVKPTYVTIRR